MEKMTRMSKYKELRESLKNDVVTTEETKAYVPNQEILKDANYYRNLVGDNSTIDKQVEIKKPVREDTLIESLTFDTITENETEEVKTALDKVRENNGQEQYNTRMDILNKIRQTKVETVIEEDYSEEVEEVVEEVEEIEEPVVENSNRFGYVKEEVEEEIDEEVEEEQVEKPKKRFGLFKRKEVEEDEEEEEIEEDEDEDEEEGSSFMVKLLNGCIIVLVLVLIGLVAFIAKEILL